MIPAGVSSLIYVQPHIPSQCSCSVFFLFSASSPWCQYCDSRLSLLAHVLFFFFFVVPSKRTCIGCCGAVQSCMCKYFVCVCWTRVVHLSITSPFVSAHFFVHLMHICPTSWACASSNFFRSFHSKNNSLKLTKKKRPYEMLSSELAGWKDNAKHTFFTDLKLATYVRRASVFVHRHSLFMLNK